MLSLCSCEIRVVMACGYNTVLFAEVFTCTVSIQVQNKIRCITEIDRSLQQG
jgi:hypothetical protein